MIHLDHAATSLPRRTEAIDAYRMACDLPSPGRGRHADEQRSVEVLERARASVSALCPGGQVCFVSSTTHALNQAIAGLRPRPRCIALCPLAHNAVWRPVSALGCSVWRLPSDAQGRIDLKAAANGWPDEVDLVVVTHASNVNGLLQPVQELCALAHSKHARVLVDAAQTAGVLGPLELGADMVAFGAHKAVGALPGVGALVVMDEVELEPLIRGGVGFDSPAADVPTEFPARLESGTMNLAGIAAFGAGAAAAQAGSSWHTAAEALRAALEAGGAEFRCVDLPIASFVPRMDVRTAEEIFDRVYDLAVRSGLHCAPTAHRTLGTLETGTLRISTGRDTTPDVFEALTAAVRAVA